MDRVMQLNWLRELAADLAFQHELGGGTAKELVEYALSEEGRDTWDIVIPAWFDAHDRSLLEDIVAESLEE